MFLKCHHYAGGLDCASKIMDNIVMRKELISSYFCTHKTVMNIIIVISRARCMIVILIET